jgi:hypothetical protein
MLKLSLFSLPSRQVRGRAVWLTRHYTVATPNTPCRPVRGMRDHFSPESYAYRYVIEQARSIVEQHGFTEVRNDLFCSKSKVFTIL